MKKHVMPWRVVNVTVLYTVTTPEFEAGYNITRYYHEDVTYVKEHHSSSSEKGGMSAFKIILESMVASQASNYIAFFVDDIVFINDFHVTGEALGILEDNKHILCVSLRLHPGITYFYTSKRNVTVPLLRKVTKDTYLWNWTQEDVLGDWGFPLSLDGNVFRKIDILYFMENVNYDNPNTLEYNMVPVINRIRQDGNFELKFMLCFDNPILVNIPANRVQQIHANKFNTRGVHSFRNLNIRFIQGERLALIPLESIKGLLNSVHIDFALNFEHLFPGKSFIPWEFLYVGMNSQAGEELFDNEENAQCLDLIYIQGRNWYWSVRDSLQHRCLKSLDCSNYVLMLDLLGDDKHSLRSYFDLQEDLNFEKMPPLEANFHFDMKKLIIVDGSHRASILLHRKFEGLPVSKVKVSYDVASITFAKSVLKELVPLMYDDDGGAYYKLPYHSFALGQNLVFRGQRNTSHFVKVLSRYISFEGTKVLEIGDGIGGNLFTLTMEFNLSECVGVLVSPVATIAAKNISRELLPWVKFNFYFQKDTSLERYLHGKSFDILLVNLEEYDEKDWAVVCKKYIRLARIVVLDSVDHEKVDVGLSEISTCPELRFYVHKVELPSFDAILLNQKYIYILENEAHML